MLVKDPEVEQLHPPFFILVDKCGMFRQICRVD